MAAARRGRSAHGRGRPRQRPSSARPRRRSRSVRSSSRSNSWVVTSTSLGARNSSPSSDTSGVDSTSASTTTASSGSHGSSSGATSHHPLAQPHGGLSGRRPLGAPQQCAQHAAKRQVRRRRLVQLTTRQQLRHPAGADPQLVQQPGFADAGRTDHLDHPAVPRFEQRERVAQRLLLELATHQGQVGRGRALAAQRPVHHRGGDRRRACPSP